MRSKESLWISWLPADFSNKGKRVKPKLSPSLRSRFFRATSSCALPGKISLGSTEVRIASMPSLVRTQKLRRSSSSPNLPNQPPKSSQQDHHQGRGASQAREVEVACPFLLLLDESSFVSGRSMSNQRPCSAKKFKSAIEEPRLRSV